MKSESMLRLGPGRKKKVTELHGKLLEAKHVKQFMEVCILSILTTFSMFKVSNLSHIASLKSTVSGAGGYEKLRQRMKQLHPVLDIMMLEHGYGRVLSRPGLSLRLRELCVVAALAGQDVAPQLVRLKARLSHTHHHKQP